jgi:hypothetical protein
MTLNLLKVHLQKEFLPIPITQKCQILSCDTLVANERHVELWNMFNIELGFIFLEFGLYRLFLILIKPRND